MRDSARQLTDSLHFLGLRKLKRQIAAFRVVDKVRDKAEHVGLAVFVVFGHRRDVNGSEFFRFGFQFDFGMGARQLCHHNLCHFVLQFRPIVGIDAVFQLCADQFFARLARQLEQNRVRFGNHAVLVHESNTDGGFFEQSGKADFGVFCALFVFFARSHVPHDGRAQHRFAVFVVNGMADKSRKRPARLRAKSQLAMPKSVQFGNMISRQQIDQFSAFQFAGIVDAQPVAKAAVDEVNHAARVDLIQSDGQSVQKFRHFLRFLPHDGIHRPLRRNVAHPPQRPDIRLTQGNRVPFPEIGIAACGLHQQFDRRFGFVFQSGVQLCHRQAVAVFVGHQAIDDGGS